MLSMLLEVLSELHVILQGSHLTSDLGAACCAKHGWQIKWPQWDNRDDLDTLLQARHLKVSFSCLVTNLSFVWFEASFLLRMLMVSMCSWFWSKIC
jgi:hypothetical protein